MRDLNERVLQILSMDWVMKVLALGTAVVVAVTLYAVLNSRGTTEALADSTEVTGCRASYNAVVVDKHTQLDILSSELRRLNAVTDNAQIAVTTDAIFNDGQNLSTLLTELRDAGRKETAKTTDVQEAEQALVDANSTYQDQVRLSREDPDEFLVVCQEINP